MPIVLPRSQYGAKLISFLGFGFWSQTVTKETRFLESGFPGSQMAKAVNRFSVDNFSMDSFYLFGIHFFFKL